MHHSGDDDPAEDSDIEALVEQESSDSNLELKLHVMGSKQLFTQIGPEFVFSLTLVGSCTTFVSHYSHLAKDG